MRKPKQWYEMLINGEVNEKIIRAIQNDALLHAAEICDMLAQRQLSKNQSMPYVKCCKAITVAAKPNDPSSATADQNV